MELCDGGRRPRPELEYDLLGAPENGDPNGSLTGGQTEGNRACTDRDPNPADDLAGVRIDLDERAPLRVDHPHAALAGRDQARLEAEVDRVLDLVRFWGRSRRARWPDRDGVTAARQGDDSDDDRCDERGGDGRGDRPLSAGRSRFSAERRELRREPVHDELEIGSGSGKSFRR